MNMLLKKFLEDNLELVDKLAFEELFEKVKMTPSLRPYNLIEIFQEIDLDPLEYMNYIPARCFMGAPELVSFTAPENIKRVDSQAFESCLNLTDIILPDSVSYIGFRAFSYCKKLKNIALPSKLTVVDNYAFNDCQCLENIVLPDSLIQIGECCFASCVNLKNVVIPTSMQIIGCRAFEDCINLKSIEYLGTKDQWNRISKGYEFVTRKAIVHCTDWDVSV